MGVVSGRVWWEWLLAGWGGVVSGGVGREGLLGEGGGRGVWRGGEWLLVGWELFLAE